MNHSQSFVRDGTRGGPKRSRILGELGGEPRSVEELATALEENPSTLQEHLAVLETNNMVRAHKRPDRTEYVLADEALVSPE